MPPRREGARTRTPTPAARPRKPRTGARTPNPRPPPPLGVPPRILAASAAAPPGPWARLLSEAPARAPAWAAAWAYCADALAQVGKAMDASGVEVLRPLLPEMVFGPFQDVAPTSIKAVLVLQDPYPLGDRVLASRLNRRSDADLRREWGDGYLARFVTQPWPEGKAPRGGPPRKIAEVPHAMGRALAYPAGIDRPPASFDGLRRLYEAASGSPPSRMAPELREWAAQGVLLINSCPVLYRHAGEDECASSAHQNIWTALTSRLLGWVASRNPCAAYVLFGRSAQGYERAIKTANSHAFVIKRTHPSPRAGEPRGENPFLLLGAYYAELAAQKHISAPVAW